MEKTNTRVLAYQLAQNIPDDMLHDISGGNSPVAPSAKTFKITGPYYAPDVEVDFNAQF